MHRITGDGFIDDALQEEIAHVVESTPVSLNSVGETTLEMNQLVTAIDFKDSVIDTKIDDLDTDDIDNVSTISGTPLTITLNNIKVDVDANTALAVPNNNQLANALVNVTGDTPNFAAEGLQIFGAMRMLLPQGFKIGLDYMSYDGANTASHVDAVSISSGSAHVPIAAGDRIQGRVAFYTMPSLLQVCTDTAKASYVANNLNSDSTYVGKVVSGATFPAFGAVDPDTQTFFVYMFIIGKSEMSLATHFESGTSFDYDFAFDTNPEGASIPSDPNVVAAGFIYKRYLGAVPVRSYDDSGQKYEIRTFSSENDEVTLNLKMPSLNQVNVPPSGISALIQTLPDRTSGFNSLISMTYNLFIDFDLAQDVAGSLEVLETYQGGVVDFLANTNHKYNFPASEADGQGVQEVNGLIHKFNGQGYKMGFIYNPFTGSPGISVNVDIIGWKDKGGRGFNMFTA